MSPSHTPLPPHFLKRMSKADRARLGKSGMLPDEILTAATIKGERDLQSTLMSYLMMRGVCPMSPTFGRKTRIKVGWPDITFAYHGVPCVWEVKFQTKKLDPEQEKIQQQLTSAENGWRHAVISTVEEAKAFLDAIHQPN